MHHIAVQLDVDIAELVQEVSKEELRSKIIEVNEHLFKDNGVAANSLLQPLLGKMDQSYEAARIYELYAKSLYFIYVHSNKEYLKIENNNWELYAEKAISNTVLMSF